MKLFLKHSARLGKKLGPILFQLPPQMKADVERLKGLIRALSRRKALKITLEFRHPSWFTQEVYDLVADAGWTVCLADMRDLPRDVPVVGPFCYIRRHGATARYASCYSDEQIAADAKFVDEIARQGKPVYVYFNNDANAYAIQNAKTLIGMIERRYLPKAGKR